MPSLVRVMEFLGLVYPKPAPGYRLGGESRFRYPVCERCGARVGRTEQARHDAWHRTLGA